MKAGWLTDAPSPAKRGCRAGCAVAAQGRVPYKALVTHGFVLDTGGRKMSKSLGNVIDPSTIVLGGKVRRGPWATRWIFADPIPAGGAGGGTPRMPQDLKQWPGYGVDVLRLWVASTEYVADITLGPVIVGTPLAAAWRTGARGPNGR